MRFDPRQLYDIAVVGRGPIGAAAALVASRAGRRTLLIGPAPTVSTVPASRAAAMADEGWDARVYALSAGARALLEDLRVWGALDAVRIAPVRDMRIYPSAAPDAPEVHLSAPTAGAEALAWIVEGANLNGAFEQALHFAPLACVDAPVEAFDGAGDPRAASLRLADGAQVRARLVIGADGARSSLRRLAGIGYREHAYAQTAVVANFRGQWPHHGCAWQWFGRHGVLALLPLPGERVSIVWSAPDELAAELMSLTGAALGVRVSALSGGRLGALAPITAAAAFPLRRIDVDHVIGPRLALVGDAAHVVHPLAGQGMNLGFGDVREWARLIGARENAGDPGERPTLRRYERARKQAVLSMRLATDSLQKLFDPRALASAGVVAGPLTITRDLGWRMVAGSDWLRRKMIEAAGQ